MLDYTKRKVVRYEMKADGTEEELLQALAENKTIINFRGGFELDGSMDDLVPDGLPCSDKIKLTEFQEKYETINIDEETGEETAATETRTKLAPEMSEELDEEGNQLPIMEQKSWKDYARCYDSINDDKFLVATAFVDCRNNITHHLNSDELYQWTRALGVGSIYTKSNFENLIKVEPQQDFTA